MKRRIYHAGLGASAPCWTSDGQCEQMRSSGVDDAQNGRPLKGVDALRKWTQVWWGGGCNISADYQRSLYACYNNGYAAGKPGTAVTVPEQTIVGGIAFTGQPCDSDAVKKYVQGVIGTNSDGKWGPASQTALQKYGQPYKDIASGCTGNPPSYGAITGGGGGTTVTTTTAAPPMAMPGTSSMSGLLSKPIVWIGLVMAAVGGYVLLTGKKGKKVKRNARRKGVGEMRAMLRALAYRAAKGDKASELQLEDEVLRAMRVGLTENEILSAVGAGERQAKQRVAAEPTQPRPSPPTSSMRMRMRLLPNGGAR